MDDDADLEVEIEQELEREEKLRALRKIESLQQKRLIEVLFFPYYVCRTPQNWQLVIHRHYFRKYQHEKARHEIPADYDNHCIALFLNSYPCILNDNVHHLLAMNCTIH